MCFRYVWGSHIVISPEKKRNHPKIHCYTFFHNVHVYLHRQYIFACLFSLFFNDSPKSSRKCVHLSDYRSFLDVSSSLKSLATRRISIFQAMSSPGFCVQPETKQQILGRELISNSVISKLT